MRLSDIIEMMDQDYTSKKSIDDYRLAWYLKELWKFNAVVVQLERDEAAAKAMATVWKEAYLDQVRENVKLQAKQSTNFEKCDSCTASWYIEQFARVSKENEELRKALYK